MVPGELGETRNGEKLKGEKYRRKNESRLTKKHRYRGFSTNKKICAIIPSLNPILLVTKQQKFRSGKFFFLLLVSFLLFFVWIIEIARSPIPFPWLSQLLNKQ